MDWQDAWNLVNEHPLITTGGGIVLGYLAYHAIYYVTRPVLEGEVAQIYQSPGYDLRVVLRIGEDRYTLRVDMLAAMHFHDQLQQGEWIKAKVKEKEGKERTLYDIINR